MSSLAKIRVQNLAKLMKELEREKGIHTYKEIHETYGVSQGYLSQVMNGTKEMGERFARKMELLMGLPEFYLDQPIDNHIGSIGTNNGTIFNGNQNTQNNYSLKQTVAPSENKDEPPNYLKDMPLLDIDDGIRFALDPHNLDNRILDNARR